MYSYQRAKVTCILSCRPVGGQGGVHRDPNAITRQHTVSFFFQTHARRCGDGKHVKVKKRQRQDILRFRADARKLILESNIILSCFKNITTLKLILSLILQRFCIPNLYLGLFRHTCMLNRTFLTKSI